MKSSHLTIASILTLVACGGSSPPANDVTKTTTTETTTTVTTPTATTTGEVDTPPKVNPDGSIVLEALLPEPAQKAGFPSQTVGDKDCWQGLGLDGAADKDFAALVDKCGAPTGMKPYTKKLGGTLSADHHRDKYDFQMVAGYCYRFFAVGDETMSDLTLRIERPDGDVVSMNAAKQPVALLDPDAAWCKHHDREFHVVVETANGKGKYVFQIWARPDPNAK